MANTAPTTSTSAQRAHAHAPKAGTRLFLTTAAPMPGSSIALPIIEHFLGALEKLVRGR